MSENDKIATFGTVSMGAMADRVPFTGTSDALGVTRLFSEVFNSPDRIRQGFIVMYNPQVHTAVVQISGYQSMWTCSFADESLSYSFGFSETNPPREGEFVLVWRVNKRSHAGIIIGRLPYSWNFSRGDRYNDPDKYLRRLYTQLDNTSSKDITCFKSPMLNRFDGSTHPFTHFRPTDVYPGEFSKVNQHNCGIKGGLFSATLLGGGASLRLSALTNAARLICESYLRHSLSGSLVEFHNGRYLSSENNMALYQEERLGGYKDGAKVWTDDSKAPVKGEDQTMRPRIKNLSGYFGHLVSKFCLRPDPGDSKTRVLGDEPKEAGVSRETIDPSGQYRLSAAGMLTFERTGRIPVPVRTAYPTDKGHDISWQPKMLEPFEHDETDPAYRQLELFDRQAYDLKNQYARVDGIDSDDKSKDPDYYVPQEEDLRPLEDKYDARFFGNGSGNETVKLNKFDKRRAGMYIGEDGSVIVRDAWGSEIVMLGGNVSISCAGNVMLLPGKTQLTIAGDDIVQKAQNSIDVHASKHDVRLSAARNMEILGGADEKESPGGVVIESRGRMSVWDGKDKGESARLSGITLRAVNQRVVLDGQKINIRSRTDTRIISGGDSIDGNVSIGAKTIRCRADKINMSAGMSNLELSKSGSASLVGRTVGLHGETGLNATKGAKMPLPMKWEDCDNVAAKMNTGMDKATEDLADEAKASDGIGHSELDNMVFGFRTSSECGTNESWVIGAPSKEFRMYEPAWVQVMKIFETLKQESVDAVPYEEKAKWSNGKPFPGKEAEDSAKYIELKDLKPGNLTDEGFNKKRSEVESKSEITTDKKLKDGYLVRK